MVSGWNPLSGLLDAFPKRSALTMVSNWSLQCIKSRLRSHANLAVKSSRWNQNHRLNNRHHIQVSHRSIIRIIRIQASWTSRSPVTDRNSRPNSSLEILISLAPDSGESPVTLFNWTPGHKSTQKRLISIKKRRSLEWFDPNSLKALLALYLTRDFLQAIVGVEGALWALQHQEINQILFNQTLFKI